MVWTFFSLLVFATLQSDVGKGIYHHVEAIFHFHLIKCKVFTGNSESLLVKKLKYLSHCTNLWSCIFERGIGEVTK